MQNDERRSSERVPSEVAPEIRRAQARRLGGDHKPALRTIEQYLESNPQDAAALFEKSRILYELGDRPASLEAKLKALDLKGASTDAVAIADMLIEDNLITEAELLLRVRLDLDDDQFTTRFTLAKLLLFSGRYLEAQDEIDLLYKRSKTSPIVRADYLQAIRHALLGDRELLAQQVKRLRGNNVPDFRMNFFDALNDFISGGNPDTFAARMADLKRQVKKNYLYRNLFELVTPDIFLGSENRAREEFRSVLGDRLQAPKISGAVFSDEELGVVHELFQRCQAVDFKEIDEEYAGFSGDRVVRAHTVVKDYRENSGLLKIGPKYRIAIEKEKMETYVLNKLHPGFHPQIISYAYSRDLAGMRLSWASVDDDEPYPIRRLYTDPSVKADELERILGKIVHPVLSGWYERNTEMRDIHLYKHLGRYADRLEESLSKKTWLTESDDTAGALRLIRDLIDKRGTERYRIPFGLHHGDLNSRNILLDRHNHVCLIDFYKSGPGMVLFDAARLEIDFRYESLVIGEAYLPEARWIDSNLVRSPAAELAGLDVRRSMEKRLRSALRLRTVMKELYDIPDDRFRDIYQVCVLIGLIRLLGYGHLTPTMERLALAEITDIGALLLNSK